MTTTQQDYSEFTGKRVNLTLVPKDGEESGQVLEGKVELGTPLAVLVKVKGKGQAQLIEAAQIADIEEIGEKAKAFTAKKLKAVDLGGVRAHLLERHGVTLEWANQVTEEQAAEYHESLGHAALKLGHVHRTDDEKSDERETAIEQAEGATDESTES